jgi:hypothetical protein
MLILKTRKTKWMDMDRWREKQAGVRKYRCGMAGFRSLAGENTLGLKNKGAE